MDDEGVELLEGAWVEEQRDAFAGCQLALRVLLVDAGIVGRAARIFLPLVQVFQPLGGLLLDGHNTSREHGAQRFMLAPGVAASNKKGMTRTGEFVRARWALGVAGRGSTGRYIKVWRAGFLVEPIQIRNFSRTTRAKCSGRVGIVTNRRSFISDEELVSQLQALLHAHPGSSDGSLEDGRAREVRSLTEELAERIYRDPVKWGYASIAPELRDDAVIDAFIALLFAVPDMRGKQPLVDWFSVSVESKFRRLWALEERQAPERERLAKEAEVHEAEEPVAEPKAGKEPSLFEDSKGIWPSFESAFPRDAFALRLRYLMQRKPAEMAVMLDAPSERAMRMRLDRARERFRMYCEQQGIKRRESDRLVGQISEEAKA